MTCIAAVKDKTGIWMGGDACAGAASNWLNQTREDKKVAIVGKFLIGYTTSFRMGQLLHYSLPKITHPRDMNNMKFMVTKFIPIVRELFIEGGFNNISEGENSAGQFLVGYRGDLFGVDYGFDIGISVNNYDAVGAGAQIALGSLFSTKNKSPQERIKMSLEAASEHSMGVRPPFTILHQE